MTCLLLEAAGPEPVKINLMLSWFGNSLMVQPFFPFLAPGFVDRAASEPDNKTRPPGT